MMGNPLRRPLQRLALATSLTLLAVPAGARSPPGEGVICAAALYTYADEVMSKCHAGKQPKLQAELRRGVKRIDAYLLKNSTMTRADLVAFKREQAGVGRPAEVLCGVDDEGLYKALTNKSPQELRSFFDNLLARPGKPTWGTCT
jgi:hypothetical protein